MLETLKLTPRNLQLFGRKEAKNLNPEDHKNCVSLAKVPWDIWDILPKKVPSVLATQTFAASAFNIQPHARTCLEQLLQGHQIVPLVIFLGCGFLLCFFSLEQFSSVFRAICLLHFGAILELKFVSAGLLQVQVGVST